MRAQIAPGAGLALDSRSLGQHGQYDVDTGRVGGEAAARLTRHRHALGQYLIAAYRLSANHSAWRFMSSA